MFTYRTHFEEKVRIVYDNATATKCFQLASRWAVRYFHGPGRLFPARSRHHVQPSYRDFPNSFVNGSYHKVTYGKHMQLKISRSCSKLSDSVRNLDSINIFKKRVRNFNFQDIMTERCHSCSFCNNQLIYYYIIAVKIHTHAYIRVHIPS